MKIIQIVTTLNFGDAVGNDIFAISDLIKEMGYKTCIYAENISVKLLGKVALGKVLHITQLKKINSDDIIIYHLSIGTDFNFQLPNYPCRKILIYHNITPPQFFEGYDNRLVDFCKRGLEGAKFLSDKIDYCLADSSFNKQDLISMGYKMKIDVLPILIPFEDYNKKPNTELLNKYNDNFTNILFTGRVAPNKKHEDIISTFYYYKKYINKNSRLIFVGSCDEKELYYTRLKTFVEKLNLDDVIFTGHIPFEDILSYYYIADIFLCLSEHEGFCVPLVEAMYFDVPIIAYNSCAVPETLGPNCMLIDKKNYVEIAELIHKVLTDCDLKEKIISNQRQRLKYFSYENTKNKFVKYISDFIEQY